MLYLTSFCMQHFAVARFVLKQWFVYDCTYFVAEMYNVVCYWKTAVFVLWINKFKCSLKTSVSLVLARLRVVPHLSAGIVARAKRERAWKSPHARKGDTLRGERKMRGKKDTWSQVREDLTETGNLWHLGLLVFTWRHWNSNYKTIDPPEILLSWCIIAAEN